MRRGAGKEDAEPVTILVVDDDDQVRTSLTNSLIALGHRVIAAADGKDALAALQASVPDLMLLDFAMPGMNGAEVAKRVRERWGVLPIVFASGYATPPRSKPSSVLAHRCCASRSRSISFPVSFRVSCGEPPSEDFRNSWPRDVFSWISR